MSAPQSRSASTTSTAKPPLTQQQSAFHLVGSDDPWALYSPTNAEELAAQEHEVQRLVLNNILESNTTTTQKM
jgi:hypothetical protein